LTNFAIIQQKNRLNSTKLVLLTLRRMFPQVYVCLNHTSTKQHSEFKYLVKMNYRIGMYIFWFHFELDYLSMKLTRRWLLKTYYKDNAF